MDTDDIMAMNCLYVSLILQLLFEGGADESNLTPAVQTFLDEMSDQFMTLDPDSEESATLYYAADMLLNPDKRKMH